MLLYLKCPATPNDWFIIELQGEISAEGNEAELSVAGLSFADISEREGQIYLKVGQHELRGSLLKLEKPLAVLKKVVSASDASSKMELVGESSPLASKTEYQVVGVVRQKYLFKDRPKVLLELQAEL